MFLRRRRQGSGDSGSPSSPKGDRAVSISRGDGNTVIGTQTRIRGRLKGEGTVLIRGILVGEIDLRGGLTVAASGDVDADVDVQYAELSGSARGSIRASQRILLQKTAVFEGRITTPVIELRPGAVIRGRASIDGALVPAKRKHAH